MVYFFCVCTFTQICCNNISENSKNLKPNTKKNNVVENSSANYFNKIKIDSVATIAEIFCKKNKYNSRFCYLIDMSILSGRNRFFVYDMKEDSVVESSLVAHGCCNEIFLAKAKFSNKPGCGCSSLGKYKIGSKYNGKFGVAYKLYGLESTNSNAFERNIVLHSYYLVPEKEIDPITICNSLGCPMVSKNFLIKLSAKIDNAAAPILLWIFQ